MRKCPIKLSAVVGTVALAVAVLVSPVAAQSASIDAHSKAIVVIDFSTHGQGPFAGNFYKKEGIIFTAGSFVGFIQGDDALIADPVIAAEFKSPVSQLSMLIAPALQGTFEYTLTAFDHSSRVVATKTITHTDNGSGVGYFSIDLAALHPKARSFVLSSTIASGFFGVSTISFSK